MARFNKQEFIKQQKQLIEEQMAFARSLHSIDIHTLEKRPNSKAWNTLECLDHMAKSMSVYGNQLKQLNLNGNSEVKISIGLKGRFFAEGMRPKGEKISYKMKTMKNLEPQEGEVSLNIQSFIDELSVFDQFIDQNINSNWNGVKITSAVGPLVKFNIAESINFLLAHNSRHILQAKKAMES